MLRLGVIAASSGAPTPVLASTSSCDWSSFSQRKIGWVFGVWINQDGVDPAPRQHRRRRRSRHPAADNGDVRLPHVACPEKQPPSGRTCSVLGDMKKGNTRLNLTLKQTWNRTSGAFD